MGIRRVCQKWHGIIADLGFHLEPIDPEELGEEGLEDEGLDFDYIPFYPKEIPIKLNLTTWFFCDPPLHHCIDHIDAIRSSRGMTRDELLVKRSEFITSPPISTVCIDIRTPRVRGSHSIAHFRAKGIRIGDLMDIIDKMSASIPTSEHLGRHIMVQYLTR